MANKKNITTTEETNIDVLTHTSVMVENPTVIEQEKKDLDLIPIFVALPESEISDLKSKISAYMKMEVSDFRYLLGQSLTNILKGKI